MSKFIIFLKTHKSIAALIYTAAIIASICLAICMSIITTTLLTEKLYTLPICITNKCVAFWLEKNSTIIGIISFTGSTIAGIVTLSGIVIALSSYQNAVKSSTLSNHLSHLSIFSTYTFSETDKRNRLNRSDIDTLKWYNLIYSESKKGNFEISGNYITFIEAISEQIKESNKLFINSGNDEYRYKHHQAAMIDLVKDAGVTLHHLPRIDFHEVEGQLLNLITTINKSFHGDAFPGLFPDRNYN